MYVRTLTEIVEFHTKHALFIPRRKNGMRPGWCCVPDAVKAANITPDQVDYHGNFTADIFEKLFEQICNEVSDRLCVPGIAISMARIFTVFLLLL